MGTLLDSPVGKYLGQEVMPIVRDNLAYSPGFNLSPNVTIARGSLLTSNGLGNLNTTQTVTLSGSLSGGNFTVTATRDNTTQTTGNIGYNPTAAQVQAALQALTIFPPGSVGVTGSTGGPFTVTFSGGLANTPIPAMVGNVGTLTGGTPAVTIAVTQTGQAAGTLQLYAGATITSPTTAPTLTATGSGGTIGAGTYVVAYTLVTAFGETTPSPGAPVTLTSAQSIQVTSITGLAASVTKVNFYVNGDLAAQATPSSGATGTVTISAISTTLAGDPPNANTANPKIAAIARFDMASDGYGNITFGAQSGGGFWGETETAGPCWVSGDFSCADLPNLDANAIGAGGMKLISGTTTSGIVRL